MLQSLNPIMTCLIVMFALMMLKSQCDLLLAEKLRLHYSFCLIRASTEKSEAASPSNYLRMKCAFLEVVDSFIASLFDFWCKVLD